MRADISPGLASLVVQMQVFFTVALAAGLLGERLRGFQFAAMALAATGLVLVGVSAGGAATPLGILLTLLAALSWAVSNLVVRSEEHTSELQSLMRISYAVFCLKKKHH